MIVSASSMRKGRSSKKKDPEAPLRLQPAEVEVPAHATIQSLRISAEPTSPDLPEPGLHKPAKGQ